MRYADFAKKHFPIEHPTYRPKVKKSRTKSGFYTGQRVCLEIQTTATGVVTRTYGDLITVLWHFGFTTTVRAESLRAV